MSATTVLISLIGSLALAVSAVGKPPPIPEVDHLTPVNPHPSDERVHYSNQVRERLGLRSPFILQMEVRPFYSPEYAVRMVVEGNDDFFPNLDRAGRITLHYTIADKNLWHAMPENNDEKKQLEVEVSTIAADLPKPLAKRLHSLWKKILRRTRYAEFYGPDNDNTFYEFATWGVYGEVWTTWQRPSPQLLVELGESLIKYCNADSSGRGDALKAIETKAEQLERYLDEHPEK